MGSQSFILLRALISGEDAPVFFAAGRQVFKRTPAHHRLQSVGTAEKLGGESKERLTVEKIREIRLAHHRDEKAYIFEVQYLYGRHGLRSRRSARCEGGRALHGEVCQSALCYCR
jgi:hypothetical protein